jgi:hypothetical protein
MILCYDVNRSDRLPKAGAPSPNFFNCERKPGLDIDVEHVGEGVVLLGCQPFKSNPEGKYPPSATTTLETRCGVRGAAHNSHRKCCESLLRSYR